MLGQNDYSIIGTTIMPHIPLTGSTLPHVDGTSAACVERLEDYWHLAETAAYLDIIRYGTAPDKSLGAVFGDDYNIDGRVWDRVFFVKLCRCFKQIADYGDVYFLKPNAEINIEPKLQDASSMNIQQYMESLFGKYRHSSCIAEEDVSWLAKIDDLRALFYEYCNATRIMLPSGMFMRYSEAEKHNKSYGTLVGPMIFEDQGVEGVVEEVDAEGETNTYPTGPFYQMPYYYQENYRKKGDRIEREYFKPAEICWLVPYNWSYYASTRKGCLVSDPVACYMIFYVSLSSTYSQDEDENGEGGTETYENANYWFCVPLSVRVESTPSEFKVAASDTRLLRISFDISRYFQIAKNLIRQKHTNLTSAKAYHLDLNLWTCYIDSGDMTNAKYRRPSSWNWRPKEEVV